MFKNTSDFPRSVQADQCNQYDNLRAVGSCESLALIQLFSALFLAHDRVAAF